jgi:hypothetical protein
VGIGGLLVVLSLIGWFGYRAWTLRDLWRNVFVLHDAHRPESVRIQAAFDISRDPRVEPQQLWDMSLRRDLPELARFLLAESIAPDLVAQGPLAYASAVSRSPDWPPWLRLVLTRPMAYAATEEHALSRDRLGELCRLNDSILRLWALYALAVQPRPDPQTIVEIEEVGRSPGPEHELAELFLRAIHSDRAGRLRTLDEATRWNRDHHPDTRRLWKDWTIQGGRVVPKASPPS